MFSGFSMGAMFEDELVDTKKPPAPPSASMLRNPSGRIVTKQGVAHQVISDDVQWKKLQEQMRQKGATSGISLKQNLNGLLQDRAKELPSQTRKQPASAASANRRRTSYIAEFATSLILGEPDHNQANNTARRMSLPTQRKLVVPQVVQQPPPERRRFSAFFTDSAVPVDKEGEKEPTIILERYTDPGPEFAPSFDLSRKKSIDFERPQKRGSRADSMNNSMSGSIHSQVIYEDDYDSEEEESIKNQPTNHILHEGDYDSEEEEESYQNQRPMARAHRNSTSDEGNNIPAASASPRRSNRSPRRDSDEMHGSGRSLGSVNKPVRITRGTDVVW
jgi:hypothetical protein